MSCHNKTKVVHFGGSFCHLNDISLQFKANCFGLCKCLRNGFSEMFEMLIQIFDDIQGEGMHTRDTYNFGIGNSICKHGLKLCGSLLDYLGGDMINLCGSLLDLWISTSRSCVALLQFSRPVFFCTNE